MNKLRFDMTISITTVICLIGFFSTGFGTYYSLKASIDHNSMALVQHDARMKDLAAANKDNAQLIKELTTVVQSIAQEVRINAALTRKNSERFQ